MTRGAPDMEKAVSRTLRETLDSFQRTAEDLNQALNDLVAACASSRPANSLSPILRAQSAAASLAARLDVLSRFVAMSLQSSPASAAYLPEVEPNKPVPPPRERSAPERPVKPVPSTSRRAAEPPAVPAASVEASAELDAPMAPEINADLSPVQEPVVADSATVELDPPVDLHPAHTLGDPDASDLLGKGVVSLGGITSAPVGQSQVNPIEELPPIAASFDISALLPEEQDLHRRANRVAKVSMQDIKMLRPDEVRLGREHRDICLRLRDDIEKAHKEYDRRFKSILRHPVDYFYDWMVEILGEGDPQTLGEYPYPSSVARR
jgi:hypothetical protein